jgi:chromate reductase, NAD(P)H dehydrogenase (quinone)
VVEENLIRLLGFAGSLRQNSYNRALLRSCQALLPEDAALDIFDLEGIPPFNQDLEVLPPDKVVEFKHKINAADALLIVTPEYNYSVPGVLKNCIDWGSRPAGDNSFQGKNVAIMSVSTGMLGGARAQYHLRQSFVYLDMYPVNKPEVFVTFASQKFDAQGKLIDEKTRELARSLIKNLIDKTRLALDRT